MYGAAARRDLVYLLSRQEPPSLSAAEESQSSEYAVPMVGPQRVFQLLRPHKQTRSIYEMEQLPYKYAIFAEMYNCQPTGEKKFGKKRKIKLTIGRNSCAKMEFALIN